MRGIYHSSLAIEAFLERYPVKTPPIGANVYFEGKATEMFSELLYTGPGRLPTVHEFQAAYMKRQTQAMQEDPRCYDRMAWQYIGLIRDYHAGALLVECPEITHVFWSPLLDVDGGVDYIIATNRRYAALHVRTDDPHDWRHAKDRRKSAVLLAFPYHVDLIVERWAHTKGNIWLCRPEDVQHMATVVAVEGAHRPAEDRIWGELGLRPLELSEDLGNLIYGKQEDLDV
jgi:hypothetical protein